MKRFVDKALLLLRFVHLEESASELLVLFFTAPVLLPQLQTGQWKPLSVTVPADARVDVASGVEPGNLLTKHRPALQGE